MPPTVRACPPPTTITRCCGGGSTSTATMAGTHVVHAHGASCAWCMVHVHGMMSTATVGRYVRKTRRYGGSWPLQIGNALFWRRETFAYVCHEEVLLAAVLAAACDEESSSEYFGREPQVGLCVGLRHTKSGRLLVAITCHLSSHFQEPWRQVAQSHAVVAAGCALAEKMGEGTAVVMGADLNSIPGSGVYQLITHATLAASHPHMQHCGRADDVSMPSFGKLGGGGADLQLTMPLASAYAAVLGQVHHPTSTPPGTREPKFGK